MRLNGRQSRGSIDKYRFLEEEYGSLEVLLYSWVFLDGNIWTAEVHVGIMGLTGDIWGSIP